MPRNDCIDFNIYPDKSQTNLRAVYDKEEPLFLYPHRDSNLDPMPINRHCEAFAILIKKSAGIARFQRFTSDPGGARTLDPMIKSHLLYQLSYQVILFRYRYFFKPPFVSRLRVQR